MANPVHMHSSGFDQSGEAVLQFFRYGYDFATFRREAHAQFDRFARISDADHTYFDEQMPSRWGHPFGKLHKSKPGTFPTLRKSLRSMAISPQAQRLSLAPAFVIGVREAGANLLHGSNISDSFTASGLDNLYDMQRQMRRLGYLPRALKLATGTAYGTVNPDLVDCKPYRSGPPSAAPRKCIIRSAAIPGKYKFLIHAGRFALAFDQFAHKARKVGFDPEEIANLPEIAHFFWTTFSLQRPVGRTLAVLRASKDDKLFGTLTYLQFLHQSGLRLSEVVDILGHADDIFKRPAVKTGDGTIIKIAMRSCALMSALDLMMRRHLLQRVDRLQLKSEFALIEGYLN